MNWLEFFPPRVSEHGKFSRRENMCFERQQHKPDCYYDLLFQTNTLLPHSKASQRGAKLKWTSWASAALAPPPVPLIAGARGPLWLWTALPAGSRGGLCPLGPGAPTRAHAAAGPRSALSSPRAASAPLRIRRGRAEGRGSPARHSGPGYT